MCKYTKQKLQEVEQWVSENGVYPQKGGAPLQDFRAAMGISKKAHHDWCKAHPEYVEAIENGNRVFAQNTVDQLVNALKKKALGYKTTKVYEQAKEQNGKLMTVSARKETIEVAPDTGALIFMLTNMDPENWKNRQTDELNAKVEVNKPVIVFGDDEEEDGTED